MQEIWYEFQGLVFGRNPDKQDTLMIHNLNASGAYVRAGLAHPLDPGYGVPSGTKLKSIPFKDALIWRKLDAGQEIDFLTTYDLWSVLNVPANSELQSELASMQTGARFELEIEVVGPTHDGQVRSPGTTRVIALRIVGPMDKNGEWQKAT